MSREQSLGFLEHLIHQQAALLSANDIFYGSALLFLALIGVVWLTHPGHGRAPGAEAAGAH